MLYPEDIIDQYSQQGCEHSVDLNKIRDAWSKAKINGHNLDHLEVKISTPKGLGVFSRKDIEKGDIVEICHCIVPEIPSENCGDRGLLQYAYHFSEPRSPKKMAIPLGFGCIYNSASTAEEANLIHIAFPTEKMLCFLANANVKNGEELLTFHGDGYFNTWCKLNQEIKLNERTWFVN
jgi:hypothetical protein